MGPGCYLFQVKMIILVTKWVKLLKIKQLFSYLVCNQIVTNCNQIFSYIWLPFSYLKVTKYKSIIINNLMANLGYLVTYFNVLGVKNHGR